RVVNPQLIGGRRMAAFALQPDVAEFLDVVMHDDSLDFRIEQIKVHHSSTLCDRTVGESALPARTGVVLLALRRDATAPFVPNPSDHEVIGVHSILIALGTPAQVRALRVLATEPGSRLPTGEDAAPGLVD
ncbi:MAG TPA: TrkA C-terminal domain-containing protein, partial [Jatrophihabitans sp.]